ncbi:MAG: hypothetical protein M3044_03935 [Thermoproteota archaeon]|nr:hypothetical protein [Thermoproteota archaeon]
MIFRTSAIYCEEQKADSNAIEQLSKYYLVSVYKPNEGGESGLGIKGSINYRLGEYVDVIFDKSIQMNEGTLKIINNLREGLSQSIKIIIASDTTINKCLIIEANKRAIALYYLKHKEESTFEQLINSKHRITILCLKTPICRIIFPFDFLSLSSEA